MENDFSFKHQKTPKLVEYINNDSNKVSFLRQLAINPLLSKNVDEALQNPNWFKAQKTEYDSMFENNFWSLVKNEEKQVGRRAHFALKFGPDGEICCQKARFVAKNFSHIFVKDFYGRHLPSTRLSSTTISMSLFISQNYQLK